MIDTDACVGNAYGDLECYNQLGVETDVIITKRDVNATVVELREEEAIEVFE